VYGYRSSQMRQSRSTSSGSSGHALRFSTTNLTRPSIMSNKNLSTSRIATPSVDSSWGEVTGLPTRLHWKPDDQADRCAMLTCQKPFSLFERRHHCRRCGDIFCAGCSANLLPLDQDAEYHPAGVMSRVCDHCMSEAQRAIAERYRAQSMHVDGTSSDWNDTSAASSPGASTDSMTTMSHGGNGDRDRMLLRTPEQTDRPTSLKTAPMSMTPRESMSDASLNPIPSVPQDWTWSTF
jgi:hypothetical protein